MKRLLPILSIAVLMAACNQGPKIDSAQQSPYIQQTAALTADTAGLAQFHAWKAQNELADMIAYNQPVQQAAPQVKERIVYRTAPAKKTSTAPRKPTSSKSTTVNPSSDDGGSGTASSTGDNTAKAPAAKKGMSKAAKGAIIGGVGGAIAGAVINKKNRVAGAVIGGVIGAGGGYTIGRGMDKKDGRVTGGGTPPFSIPPGVIQK